MRANYLDLARGDRQMDIFKNIRLIDYVVAWNSPEYICNVLCDVSVLFLPTVSDVFVLQTDASGRGVGAVLSVCRDGDELPVGYFSRKLKPTERKYSATELECLAVVQAIDYFAAHLIGRPFIVETDHKALQYLQRSRHLNGRLTHWALKLQSYSFTIRYRPGKSKLMACHVRRGQRMRTSNRSATDQRQTSGTCRGRQDS